MEISKQATEKKKIYNIKLNDANFNSFSIEKLLNLTSSSKKKKKIQFYKIIYRSHKDYKHVI